MNGRLYDPVIARFFSPDKYVANSSFTQDFNRYMYARGCPLMYTDPDGEFFQYVVWAVHYLCTGLENKFNGVADPWGDAKKQADGFVNGVNNALRIQIYQDDNWSVSAGMDMFGLGVSFNASYTTLGGTTIGGTLGYSAMGGTYGGIGINQQIGDWNIGGGVGFGKNSWGWNVSGTYKGYGLGYGRTSYGGAHAQTTGTASIYWPGGSFRLENDFLRFDKQDRWRTSAWELNIGNWSIGSNVYTNDPLNDYGLDDFDRDGVNLLGNKNRMDNKGFQWGAWKNGQVYSSPIWVGYRNGNSITRIGYSNPWVQDRTQNLIHRWFGPGRQHYYNRYNDFQYGWWGYIGYYNPFSLYE
jgi:hypothetical protein